MSDSGTSRQLELTPWRMRAAAALLVIAVCASGVLVVVALGSVLSRGSHVQEAPDLETVKSLQEEMKKKDLALAVLEKRLKETQEASSSATSPRTTTGPTATMAPETESDSHDAGPLTELEESLKPRKPVTSRMASRDDGEKNATGLSADTSSPGAATSEPGASFQAELNDGTGKIPIINFDAHQLTAASEGPNNGALSFKLVKDQPDVRFSGYLFVVVEIVDQRGENKIYVYPNDTRLGEEELPSDFKQGKGVSFKLNQYVELSYGDMRVGAALSRVSIVLYAENGRIVFQRSFDKKEVKMTTAKNAHAEGARQKAGERRRAL